MADPAPTAAEQAWRAAVAKVLQGGSLHEITSRTRDGLAIAPLYPTVRDAGPGPWRAGPKIGILPRVDHPDPGAGAELARLDLDNGATGLTLVGTGSASAFGFGLAPNSLPVLLKNAPRWTQPMRLDFAPADGVAAVEAVLTEADRAGYTADALAVDAGFDPLASAGSLCRNAEVLRRRGLTSPLLRADGRPHHHAGATEAQELAAVLSAGVAGLRALEPLGLDGARDALSFTLTADTDELLTIARLRALRRLWAQVETACGLAPRPIRLHVETAWRTMARRDPYANILRGTLATAGAILGGADSVTVLPFTTALGLPDDFARRLARNTALVLLEEAHLGSVADPAAGAGAFEALTDALAEEAWTLFQEIERQGGLAAALEGGWWAGQVGSARAMRTAAIADGSATLVGVTRFANPDGTLPSVLLPMADGGDGPQRAPAIWREAAAFEAIGSKPSFRGGAAEPGIGAPQSEPPMHPDSGSSLRFVRNEGG